MWKPYINNPPVSTSSPGLDIDMIKASFNNIAIKAVAAAVPSFVQKIIDHHDRYSSFFQKNVGVKQRHISITEQTCLDLGYIALQNALAKAQWEASSLELVIFNTQTPDFCGGTSNSVMLHHYMNLPEECSCFDISQGCSGYAYALSTACALMNNSNIRRAAVLFGDNQWSTYRNKEELLADNNFTAGEGTGAILLERISDDNNANTMNFTLFTKGSGYKHMCHYDTGFKNKWRYPGADGEYLLPDGNHYSHGNYKDAIEFNYFVTDTIANKIEQAFGKNIHCYDYYILSQTMLTAWIALVKRLGIDQSKAPISLDHYANTSESTPVLTMCHNLTDLAQSAHIFTACFGIGFSWGFCDFVLNPGCVCPVVATDHRFDEHFLRPYNGDKQ